MPRLKKLKRPSRLQEKAIEMRMVSKYHSYVSEVLESVTSINHTNRETDARRREIVV